jgi:hypothetical protein
MVAKNRASLKRKRRNFCADVTDPRHRERGGARMARIATFLA